MIPGGLPTLSRSSGCRQPLLPAPLSPVPAASPARLWGRPGPAEKTAALHLVFLNLDARGYGEGDWKSRHMVWLCLPDHYGLVLSKGCRGVTRVSPGHHHSAAKDAAHRFCLGRSLEQESIRGGIFTSADAAWG